MADQRRYLRTSDLSRAAGVHPNTVRFYEAWGVLPPIPRSPAGYRLFTPAHLEQLKLVRLALSLPFPGKRLRKSALALVKQAAGGDLPGALGGAHRHLALVQSELAQAEAAAAYLEAWAGGSLRSGPARSHLQSSQAARLLDVTPDTLRHWERNGLITAPRDPHTGYRLYGPAEIGRLRVIRLLTRAGYSTMAVLRMVRHLDAGRHAGLRELLNTPAPDEDILYAADRWLTTLQTHVGVSQAIITQLEVMINQSPT